MSQESMSSTKVLDEEGGQSGNYGGEDEESIVSDKAVKISQRLGRELYFSLYISTEDWAEAGVFESKHRR